MTEEIRTVHTPVADPAALGLAAFALTTLPTGRALWAAGAGPAPAAAVPAARS